MSNIEGIINSVAPERYECNVEVAIRDRPFDHFLRNCPGVNVTRHDWWLVNIGSGNGLVPFGNEPLTVRLIEAVWRFLAHVCTRWVLKYLNLITARDAVATNPGQPCDSHHTGSWDQIKNIYRKFLIEVGIKKKQFTAMHLKISIKRPPIFSGIDVLT